MNHTEQKERTGIVSDVVTYPGLIPNERYIHCSIGGVRQPAKKLSDEDNKQLDTVIESVRQSKNWAESRAFRLSLAEKYYKAEIVQTSQGHIQSQGMKR